MRNTRVDGVDQLCVAALDKPYTRQNIPPAAVSTPGTSSPAPGVPACLPSSATAPATDIAANTRLTYMHHRQDSADVSAPPTIRPSPAPLAATAPNAPNALPRSFGSLKVVASKDSA